MLRLRFLPLLLSVLAVGACGADGGSSGGDPSGSSSGGKAGSSSGGSSGTSSGTPASGDPLVGLWEVSGTDARGAYVGQVEIRNEAGTYRFVRTVRYPDVKVEDGRELHWLFRGTLTQTGSSLALKSSLKRLDFISERGGLKRTAADVPLDVTGTLTLSQSGDSISGTITATGISLTDEWRSKKSLPTTPLFTDGRSVVPAHDPPSAAQKTASFALFSTYQSSEPVKPYQGRAEFQAAVHRNIVDTTDLDFYRANKTALRVVDKPIDDISIAETRARADAYRYTLGEKAAKFDADVETRFLDPAVGMLPDGGTPGTALGAWNPSGDGSLWTGVYLASQVYRFQTTGEAKAKQNILVAIDALLKLQEITGDWTTFARTLRKAGETPPSPPWHAGTGQFAGLEWLEGGNNDMIKGLLYGYLLAFDVLCANGATGNDAICTRIRTNAKHLADDVTLAGSNSPTANDKLPGAWLYAIVTDDLGDALSYKLTATGYWNVEKQVMVPVSYEQGIVDWSGQHLSSISDMIGYFQAKHLDLGGSVAWYTEAIDKSHAAVDKQRFPNWHLLKAAFGTSGGPTSPFIKDAVLRMNEVRYPKLSNTIDHRINPDFCMGPYPSLPWKNDWTTNDRTNGLDLHPLFEMAPDVMSWKVGRAYRAQEGYETPGGDFLHLYWFARKYGLITGNE